MKKYLPLFEHLSSLPARKKEVTIKLSEIERIIGAALPRSASEYIEWWANQDYGSQAPSWLEAGFIVDHIDLQRGVVTFARGSRKSSLKVKPSKNETQKTRTKKKPTPASYLLDSGFEVSGEWGLKSDRLELIGSIPDKPGVYAFVAYGYVNYIGVATRGLKSRLKLYANPSKSQATNIRINPLIKKCIHSGNTVQILTVCPGTTTWNGITLGITPGLELALIRNVQPPWNKAGIS